MHDPHHSPQMVEPLTARELEVLALLCEGDSNLDIARRLDVGLATIKYHVNQIFGKLGVQRRTQAVAMAIHLRLLSPAWLNAAPRRTLPSARSAVVGRAAAGP